MPDYYRQLNFYIDATVPEWYIESEDFPELHEQIKFDERAYRYEGIGPNWQKIAELIVKYSPEGK